MSKRGLYEKYDVREDGEPVEGCFVLEPESDPAARKALLAYADATDDEALADDLCQWVNRYLVTDHDDDLRTDGGEDEVETDHEIRCYHCERVVDRRSVSMIETPIDHDEGLGYDMVPVPWCRSCQLEIRGHECDRCGRRHMDLEDALLCCDRELGPVPAGGERNV